MVRAGTVAVLLAAALPSDGGDAPSKEYRVKAAFLINFGKFVHWPGERPGQPLVLGVFGKDPFGEVLDAFAGKKVRGRELVVRRVSTIAKASACHVLFVGRAERARRAKLLRALRKTIVLSVGEVKGFAHRGGVVNFYLKDGKVRFEINIDAAARARLKIDPRLLRLGRIVREKGP